MRGSSNPAAHNQVSNQASLMVQATTNLPNQPKISAPNQVSGNKQHQQQQSLVQQRNAASSLSVMKRHPPKQSQQEMSSTTAISKQQHRINVNQALTKSTMDMLDSVTADSKAIIGTNQSHQATQQLQQQIAAQQIQLGGSKIPRKFQLPQLNLNLNQSMQFEAPASLIN